MFDQTKLQIAALTAWYANIASDGINQILHYSKTYTFFQRQFMVDRDRVKLILPFYIMF